MRSFVGLSRDPAEASAQASRAGQATGTRGGGVPPTSMGQLGWFTLPESFAPCAQPYGDLFRGRCCHRGTRGPRARSAAAKPRAYKIVMQRDQDI